MSEKSQLIAIVGVDKDKSVQCQHLGCGHQVYRRIHIVKEAGRFFVLGSTCFEKHFGATLALGNAAYGSGDGRQLTVEERELLIQNTQELIASFEREHEEIKKKREEVDRLNLEKFKARKSSSGFRQVVARIRPGLTPGWRKSDTPWPWSKPLSSIICFTLTDGSKWVRTEHVDGFHMMMPWPNFDGWDEALPPTVGTPNIQLGGYRIEKIALAVAYMRERGNFGIVGGWRDVMGLNS